MDNLLVKKLKCLIKWGFGNKSTICIVKEMKTMYDSTLKMEINEISNNFNMHMLCFVLSWTKLWEKWDFSYQNIWELILKKNHGRKKPMQPNYLRSG